MLTVLIDGTHMSMYKSTLGHLNLEKTWTRALANVYSWHHSL